MIIHTSFLLLALKRTQKRFGLTLLSLLGIALTVGLITSIPVFTNSVGFHILKHELAEDAYGNASPPLAIRFYRIPSAPQVMTVQEALDTGKWLGQLATRETGLPVERSYYQIGSHAFMIRALPDDTRYANKDLRQVRINCVPGINEHINIIEGRPLEDADTANELLVWARPEFLSQVGLQIGEQFELFNYNAVHPDQPLRFRVAGVWEAKDSAGEFWYKDPHELMAEEFLTSIGAFGKFIAPYMPEQTDFCFWYHVLDEKRMRFEETDRYTKGIQLTQLKAESTFESLRVDRLPLEPLKEVQIRTRVLKQLLYGFSVPIIAVVLFFVTTIASISVRYQQNELAIIMSRGGSRIQVLGLGALEGLIHIVLGAPLGVLASLGLAKAMSLNTGFMTFDRREPLDLAVQALDWRLIAIALAIALIARLLPVFKASQQTIVSYVRERARASGSNVALVLLFTVILIAASGYAYYRLTSLGTFSVISWDPQAITQEEQSFDPLLFLAPTLFVFTVAWIVSWLFPLLMRIPDLFGRLLPSMSLYLGFRNLSRESGPYRTPLFLLILCLCLGIFEASLARSADSWLVERWHYKAGADYSFELTVAPSDAGYGYTGEDAWLMPVDAYRSIPGVTDSTRIGNYDAIPSLGQPPKVQLLGIDRLDFARVAYFRRDYAKDSLGELLNKLGQNPDGILVTQKFLDDTGLSIGDPLIMNVIIVSEIQTMPFTIVGTFDYFPTIYESELPGMVANLDYIFGLVGGAQPHDIWLRTAPDVDPLQIQQGLRKLQVVAKDTVDGRTLIHEDEQRLERVGIFGNLTVGFAAGSVLAWIGLLIYTLASMIGRVRRFTILRALGLRLRQVLATVSIEYLGVICYGILTGAAAGVVMSKLFTPYFQFTEDVTNQIPPFVPEIAWREVALIVIAYFVALSIAEFLVLLRATRREVFQALRLGDEE